MKNDYVVLSVQFYNDKQNQFTGKYYDYLLDKQKYFKYRNNLIKHPFTFEITSGYNYRGSKVRAMAARNINGKESVNDFKIIQDFWFAPLINRGHCNEGNFLTEVQDAFFKVGEIKVSGIDPTSGTLTFCDCNCDATKSVLSTNTTTDNNYYSNYSDLSVTGIVLGSDSCSTNFAYIPNGTTTTSGITYRSNLGNMTLDVGTTSFSDQIDKIEKELETLKNNKNEKENIKMNKFGLNIKFGKVPTSEIRMSMYGPAFKSTDGWFANKDGEYINVDGFLFGEENYCYMLPVTEDNLELGDYILHNGSWCRVIDVDESGRLVVEKIMSHEVVTVLATKNVFGFEFFTKLVSLIDMFDFN